MKCAIVVFPGTSCEQDTYQAISVTLGEKAEFVKHDATNLEEYDAIILPGGTSYGDAVRPGSIASMQPVMKEVAKAAEAGKPVLGIGNGFQVLIEAGLLPGALFRNESLRFVCKPVQLKVDSNESWFTSRFEKNEIISIPVAHGYGNYYCDEATLAEMKENNQIIFIYASENPNGSTADIAGISNKKGNVLGMMPHPERAVDELFGNTDGLNIFQSILAIWRESYANA